jgi:hypothetical protein
MILPMRIVCTAAPATKNNQPSSPGVNVDVAATSLGEIGTSQLLPD